MNISVSELMVVVLIALLVIRPEQMPEVAFTLGRLFKVMRGHFQKIKNEVTGLVESVEKNHEQP